jgi:hypothetical protein
MRRPAKALAQHLQDISGENVEVLEISGAPAFVYGAVWR